MLSNNPFEVHGIEHLSISKLNLWVNDPAKFIATYLCDMKSTVGVGAFRGTSVEYAINEKLKERIDIQKENTEEIKKQQTETDKLKDKMTAVGEEIESSIKSNLKDAITGAQSFGEAMRNV